MIKLNIKNKFVKEIVEWLILIVIAIVFAQFINNVIITNSYIPTPSMETTLPVGSRLFGFRLNYLFSKPKRGDIVIFDYGFECKKCKRMYQKNEKEECPFCQEPSKTGKKVHYIKRVIALPGEHIEVKADYTAKSSSFKVLKFKNEMDVSCGHVYINGEQLTEDYLAEPMIVDENRYKTVDLIVPDDCYFVMGDNRNNSEDARFWPNQFLTNKDIEAKAYFVYWPFNKFGIVK